MTAPHKTQTAEEAFLANLSLIDDMLEAIAEAREDFFGVSASKIEWADVGSTGYAIEQLEKICAHYELMGMRVR